MPRLGPANVALTAGLLMMPVVIAVGFWADRQSSLPISRADLRGSLDEGPVVATAGPPAGSDRQSTTNPTASTDVHHAM